MSSIWNQTNNDLFFKEELTEERTDLFLRLWTGACAGRASREAWILIKSNGDCDASKVNFLYAIDSRNGAPPLISHSLQKKPPIFTRYKTTQMSSFPWSVTPLYM